MTQTKERRFPDMIGEGLYQDSMFRLTATYAPWQEAADSNAVVYVAECELGRGVFARRTIRKGDIILAFGGPLIDFAETRRRGPRECMAIQVGPNQYIDTLPPGVFANHSCAPNAGIQNDRDLAALRDIQSGEEIRYDYSTTMDEKCFTMHCQCGAPGCRRVVTDFSELPVEVQEFYLSRGLVMSFIARRLRGVRTASTWKTAGAVQRFGRAVVHPTQVRC
jgi:hypothetical protein